jgi:hypothetical protein
VFCTNLKRTVRTAHIESLEMIAFCSMAIVLKVLSVECVFPLQDLAKGAVLRTVAIVVAEGRQQ